VSELQSVRQALVDDIGDIGVTVQAGWPDEISPPLVIVVPPAQGQYLTSGPELVDYTVNLDIICLVEHGEINASTEALEELVEAVLANTSQWPLQAVDAPTAVNRPELGGPYFGTIVHVQRSYMPE